MYVLDSDHLSLHQRGHQPLKTRLLQVPPEQIAITIISVEELIRGRLAQVRRSAAQPNHMIVFKPITGYPKRWSFYAVLPFCSMIHTLKHIFKRFSNGKYGLVSKI